jgi:AcrR family transcriptional regulator
MGEEIQRGRILKAIAEEMASRENPHSATVADVVARARVSRRTFYELYADREDCFLAAYEWGLQLGAAEMYTAYAREARWQDGVRAALAALLGLLDREPALARLCIVYALGAGSKVQQRRMQAIETVREFVDRGRLENSGRIEPPEVAAEGVVGAVLAVVHTRLLESDHANGRSSADGRSSPDRGSSVGGGSSVRGGSSVGSGISVRGRSSVDGRSSADRGSASAGDSLIELLGPLMNLILLPYLGAARASRELSRPAPRVAGSGASRDGVSLGAGMRITYRTARVLQAIGKRPGASNREVADQAGIVDQGQISRLLGRLMGLGLIANVGPSSSRGSANAWVLTPRGQEVQRGIPA